jgi:adenylate kinase family enzyme
MPPPSPQRLWIVGHSGSGKSFVADRIAAVLGCRAIHLDEIHWQPGWIERTPAEEIELLTAVIFSGNGDADRWVIDGNYPDLRERFADRVDLFVWLDLPLRVTFPRVVRRTVHRARTGEPCCNGNRESLVRAFFDRESILLWTLRMDRPRRVELDGWLQDKPHVRLQTPTAVRDWLIKWPQQGRPVQPEDEAAD